MTTFPPRLTLSLKIEVREDGSLNLSVIKVGSNFSMYLKEHGLASIIGKKFEEVCNKDRSFYDEMMEFLVKARYMPEYVWQKNSKDMLYQTIHYFNVENLWRKAWIAWNRAKDIVKIILEKLSDEQSICIQQLKTNEWRHKLSDYITTDYWWEIDIKSQSIFISGKLVKILMLAEDATVIPLSRFLGTVHPDDLSKLTAMLDNIDTEVSVIYVRNVLKEGSQISFNMFAIAKYNDHGEMVRIVGCSHDKLEQLHCENELSECLEHFKLITEHAPVIYMKGDLNFRCTYISPNIEDMYGIGRETLMDTQIDLIFVHAEDRERVSKEAREILLRKSHGQVRCRVKVKEGYRWILIHMHTALDNEGEAKGFISFFQDITNEVYLDESNLYSRSYDRLTNFYSRAYFLEEMQRLQLEEDVNLSLVLVDINGLKLVNHSLGIERGDEALVEVAQILRQSFSGNHKICRIGDGEFGIFIYDSNLEHVEKMCMSIGKACQKTQRRMLPLSLSWGIAERDGRMVNMNEVFTLAEKRMYGHKILERSSLHGQAILALKETLRTRNVETADHMERMEKLAVKLGRQLDLKGNEIDRLILLASLHDIGKMAIPDRILNKPGRLTEDEMEIMKTHCLEGSRIAGASHELSGIANELLCHHEHWDGTGYPTGLRGESIPLLSRIIAVADSYDVMTSERVYKKAMNKNDAVSELKRCAGTQFDPLIVERFINAINGPPAH